MFLIVFIARVTALMRRAEGDTHWLWSLALGGALAWVSIEMATAATEAAAFYVGSRGLDLQTTRGLLNAGNFGFFISGVFGALFLATVAVVILRTQFLPRWLGWFGAGVAVIAFVSTPVAISPAAQIAVPLRAIWVLAAGITLMRTSSFMPAGTEAGASR